MIKKSLMNSQEKLDNTNIPNFLQNCIRFTTNVQMTRTTNTIPYPLKN